MERLLAHAIVWRNWWSWADRYNDVLNGILTTDGPWHSQLLSLSMLPPENRDEAWEIFRSEVIPRVGEIDQVSFRSELVSILKGIYRDPNVSLEDFATLAYRTWILLQDCGMGDDSLSELAFADDFLGDGGTDTRLYYEDLFERYRSSGNE